MNILNKLTIKHLKMNKKRTIVSIIGVILSTALMVGIGLIFSTIRDNSIKGIINTDGSQHVVISLDYDKLDVIKNNNKVKSYDYISLLGYSKYEGLKNNPYIEIVTSNNEYYEKLKLLEGRLPENDKEIVIPQHLLHENIEIKIGDTLNLNVGDRYYKDEYLNFNNEYFEEEELKNTKNKQYLVVGIIERDVTEGYNDPAYMAFTKEEVKENNYTKALVTYKNIRDTYKVTPNIATTLGYTNLCLRIENECYFEVIYNEGLLSLSGTSQYGNVIDGMSQVIIIILSLVSIACIIVIYNSFAISVMERKKQFGLFASIGTTRKQLSKTVFFEAFIIALIGIPIGVLSGILGIGIVIEIVNYLLPNIFDFLLTLSIYPLFIIIPIIFMIVTIFISAYIPSRMASRVSPIVAIRQNDDIKIKNKNLKTPKFIRKFFGVEGEIALKNMKRNRKKYRVTIVSLFISIVLFISFSAITEYGLNSVYNFTEMPKYDIELTAYDRNANYKSDYLKIIDPIVNNKDVKYHISIQTTHLYTDVLDKSYYNEDYIKNTDPSSIMGEYIQDGYLSVSIIGIDEENYNSYLKELGLKDRRVIVVNNGKYFSYEKGNRKYISFTPYSEKKLNLQLYNAEYDIDVNFKKIGDVIENVYYTKKLPKFIYGDSSSTRMTIIMSFEDLNKYIEKGNDFFYNYSTYIEAPKYNNVWPEIQKKQEEYEESDIFRIYGYNVREEMRLISNGVLVIKILLYGFITLVTLIGVTSVFNTINTSINLRRKEFSMLRSMGLTPKGFNKILYFESLFFGLKSLLYGIPVSIFVIMLLHSAFGTIVKFESIIIPIKSIIIAIIGVFIIVIISMMYASSKVKKENILDAIREENI